MAIYRRTVRLRVRTQICDASVLQQAFPQYLQQYDISFRSSDPSLGQLSFVGTAQTAARPQQPVFASQVRIWFSAGLTPPTGQKLRCRGCLPDNRGKSFCVRARLRNTVTCVPDEKSCCCLRTARGCSLHWKTIANPWSVHLRQGMTALGAGQATGLVEQATPQSAPGHGLYASSIAASPQIMSQGAQP